LRAYLSYDDVAVEKDLPDLVAFMVSTGKRIGEVALSWSDISLQDGAVAFAGPCCDSRARVGRETPEKQSG